MKFSHNLNREVTSIFVLFLTNSNSIEKLLNKCDACLYLLQTVLLIKIFVRCHQENNKQILCRSIKSLIDVQIIWMEDWDIK